MGEGAFLVNPDPARVSRAAGTQLARFSSSHGLAGQRGRNRMVKTALVLAALLAVAPAVATLAWPKETGQAPERSVELNGPILSFTQTRDHIQVRLQPARTDAEREARDHVVIRGENGQSFASPLRRGQTWVSIELPGDLADAGQIDISVE
jgi:hypothetical protein